MELDLRGNDAKVARRSPEAEELRGKPAIWTVEDWTKVLGQCTGEGEDFTFASESVKMNCAEEKTFAKLFKKPRSRKNGYRTTEYCDQMRRIVAVALIQILRSSRTTYMATWQVGIVERAVAGKPMGHASYGGLHANTSARYCEAVKSSKLESRERLDADCSELQSQVSAVEEQLIIAKAKLLETETMIQKLKGQTDAALCAKIDRCLRGYVD